MLSPRPTSIRDDLARTQVRRQVDLGDRRLAGDGVVRAVGVGAEVHGAVERRQRQVVAMIQVGQDLTTEGSVAGPHPDAGMDWWADVDDGTAHSRCRIAQRSGKIGWNRVDFRYARPAVPPEPGLLPMVRSTSFTWR